MRLVPGFVISLKKIMGWVRRRRVRNKKEATKSQQAGEGVLPDDIILLVLAKLPIRCLLRFKCVSKSWNRMVSDPHFLQLNQRSAHPSVLYYRDYLEKNAIYRLTFNTMNSCFYDVQLHPPWKKQQKGGDYLTYEILGSCNGLLLVIGRYAGDLILWNPLTSQFRILPKYPYSKIPSASSPYKVEGEPRASYGFGYDVSTDDYKVVRAVPYSSMSFAQTFVFSVKSNTWSIGKIHSTLFCRLTNADYLYENLSMDTYKYDKGIILDGILHWLHPRSGEVTTFDLSTEELGTILLPECNPIFGVWIYLGTLRGKLCFWYYYKSLRYVDDGLMIDVWVMKEYGVMSSWTKLLVLNSQIPLGVFPTSDVFLPFLFSSKEDELIYFIKKKNQEEYRPVSYIDEDEYQYRMTVKYNLGNLTFDNVGDLPDRIHRYSFPYMESLVSIGKSFKAAAS